MEGKGPGPLRNIPDWFYANFCVLVPVVVIEGLGLVMGNLVPLRLAPASAAAAARLTSHIHTHTCTHTRNHLHSRTGLALDPKWPITLTAEAAFLANSD